MAPEPSSAGFGGVGAVNGSATFLVALTPGPQLRVSTGSCGTSTHRQRRASFVARRWPPVANVCRGLDPRPQPSGALRCGRLHNRSAGRHEARARLKRPAAAGTRPTRLRGDARRAWSPRQRRASTARRGSPGMIVGRLWDVTPAPRHPLAHQTKQGWSPPERDRGAPSAVWPPSTRNDRDPLLRSSWQLRRMAALLAAAPQYRSDHEPGHQSQRAPGREPDQDPERRAHCAPSSSYSLRPTSVRQRSRLSPQRAGPRTAQRQLPALATPVAS